MSTGNTDEIQTQRQIDTCLSHQATLALDIWTWGDGEGPDRSEPRSGGSPGRVLGGGEHLSRVSIHRDLQNVASCFSLSPDLGITLGAGGR